MIIDYGGFWKLFNEGEYTQQEIVEAGVCYFTTFTKLRKGEPLDLSMLERICKFFNCTLNDIVSFSETGTGDVPDFSGDLWKNEKYKDVLGFGKQ